MAIDSETAILFLAARKAGINFDRVLMLGRQNIITRPSETKQLFEMFGLKADERLLTRDAYDKPPFAEPFFEALGAKACESMDYSSYEGATIVHDLNEPLPPNLREQYDMVFDGGTLEHVFHFPQALHNAMHLVKPGGYYAGFTPGNNWFGHGFYQFSPEVYYRALSRENGFSKCAVFIVPEGLGLKWYLVADPAELKSRTNLITGLRTPMLVLAKRTGAVPDKLRLQQSDYESFWQNKEAGLNTGKIHTDSGMATKVKRFLYQSAPRFTRRLATLEARPWSREYTVKKPNIFVPVNPPELPDFLKRIGLG